MKFINRYQFSAHRSLRAGAAFALLPLLVAACSSASDDRVVATGQVRSALDFGKLPDLATGQLAIEQRNVGMYQDLPVDIQPVDVRLDNPLVAWHGTMGVQSSPEGDLPEEHFVRTSPFATTTTYGDLALTARDGDGPYAEGAMVGSVTDFHLLSYARYHGGASPKDAASFVTRGLRVGYTPLEVHGAMYDRRDANQRRTLSKFVKLDPRVYLVPVEVWVTASANYPANNQRLNYQGMLWDQLQHTNVSASTEPNIGRVKTKHTPGITAEGGRIETWMEPAIDSSSKEPVYPVNSDLFTPDSIYAACGVQFRMVQYRVVNVLDRVAFPLRYNDPKLPADDQHYEDGTFDDRPCRDRAGLVVDHPDHRPGRLVVTFTERPEFTDTKVFERVVRVGSENVVCGTMKTTQGISGTVLAHEIGHVAGLDDCNASDTCRLMVSEGGGSPPPTPRECGVIRRWARGMADHSWPTSGTELEPAPVGDWSWPD